jgi:hypothetical protein
MLSFYPSRISDSGLKKAPDPGSATLITLSPRVTLYHAQRNELSPLYSSGKVVALVWSLSGLVWRAYSKICVHKEGIMMLRFTLTRCLLKAVIFFVIFCADELLSQATISPRFILLRNG